jgi:hypothetical protein
MPPTIQVDSMVHVWRGEGPIAPPHHLYNIFGRGWTPGTMVFVVFEHLRGQVELPEAQAGPSAMVDPRGNFHCWWLDNGQDIPAGRENRLVTASTNDGTGRTVTTSMNGPVRLGDPETHA